MVPSAYPGSAAFAPGELSRSGPCHWGPRAPGAWVIPLPSSASLDLVFLVPLSWFATSPRQREVETWGLCEHCAWKFKTVLKVRLLDFRSLGAMRHECVWEFTSPGEQVFLCVCSIGNSRPGGRAWEILQILWKGKWTRGGSQRWAGQGRSGACNSTDYVFASAWPCVQIVIWDDLSPELPPRSIQVVKVLDKWLELPSPEGSCKMHICSRQLYGLVVGENGA